MSTGQRFQFTVSAEVTTSIAAHPSGILEITRHTDNHGLKCLFGPPKSVDGHSDAEVMLYLLAQKTGWLDKLVERATKGPDTLQGEGQEPLVLEADYVTDRFLLFVRQDGKSYKRADCPDFLGSDNAKDVILGAIRELRHQDQPAHVFVHTNGIGASLFDLLKRESRVVGFALYSTPARVISIESEAANTPLQTNGTMSPVVIDDGMARAARHGEKAIGIAHLPDHAVPQVPIEDSPLPPISPQSSSEGLRKRAAIYAEAIGIPAKVAGRDVPFEDLVREIFNRVPAGGEAKASEILPGLQSLRARWREADGTALSVVDDTLGVCQRALALWISRENFLRDRIRGTLIDAQEVILGAVPPDGSSRVQWIAKRDALLETIQWLVSDMNSKSYHPSHDAEDAFGVLHDGLGFKGGSFVMVLKDLAQEAIARLAKLSPKPPAPEPHSGGIPQPFDDGFVAGGPQRPKGTFGPGHS